MRVGVSVRTDIRRSMGLAVKRAVDLVLRPARPMRRQRVERSYRIEPLESRQYLTAVTLTGSGAGATAFLASLNFTTGNIDFYVNGSPGNGTPVQSVAASNVSSVAINDVVSGDSLTVDASGASFAIDGSHTTALTLDLQAGSITLSTTQFLDNVEVEESSNLVLAGNITVNSLTVDGTATHSSGVLTANVLNVDNEYTDAGGSTASGIQINNYGTFTAIYAGSLAGTQGGLYDAGMFVENIPAGETNTIGLSVGDFGMSFDLLSGTVQFTQSMDSGGSLTIEGTNGNGI